jgi:hypothetical protein
VVGRDQGAKRLAPPCAADDAQPWGSVDAAQRIERGQQAAMDACGWRGDADERDDLACFAGTNVDDSPPRAAGDDEIAGANGVTVVTGL